MSINHKFKNNDRVFVDDLKEYGKIVNYDNESGQYNVFLEDSEIELKLEEHMLKYSNSDEIIKTLTSMKNSSIDDVTAEKLILELMKSSEFSELAFIKAVKHGKEDVVKELLKNNKELINTQDIDGNTGLILSLINSNKNMFINLIENGADSNIRNTENDTALILASIGGVDDAVDILLKHGADPNLKNRHGDTALILVSDKDSSVDIITSLLNHGAVIDILTTNFDTPLMLASNEGYIDNVNILLERGAEINLRNKDGDTALILASEKGHIDVVNVLLERGAVIDISNINFDTALILASNEGHIDIVNILLKRGADPNLKNRRGDTALILASDKGHIDVVTSLLNYGAVIDILTTNFDTALILASNNGHIDIVNILLKRGANPNLKNRRGYTALMLAIFSISKTRDKEKYIEIALTLIEKGSELDIQYDNGFTCLMDAVSFNFQEIAIALIEKGANLEIKNLNNETALTIAIFKGFINIIAKLLEKGANIDKFVIEKNGKINIVKNIFSSTNPSTRDTISQMILEEYEKRKKMQIELQKIESEKALAELLNEEKINIGKKKKKKPKNPTSPPPSENEAEAERLKAERLEAERLEAERLKAERIEAERLEAERLKAERLEAERLEAERLEAERLEAERIKAERLEAERLEAERIKAERKILIGNELNYFYRNSIIEINKYNELKNNLEIKEREFKNTQNSIELLRQFTVPVEIDELLGGNLNDTKTKKIKSLNIELSKIKTEIVIENEQLLDIKERMTESYFYFDFDKGEHNNRIDDCKYDEKHKCGILNIVFDNYEKKFKIHGLFPGNHKDDDKTIEGYINDNIDLNLDIKNINKYFIDNNFKNYDSNIFNNFFNDKFYSFFDNNYNLLKKSFDKHVVYSNQSVKDFFINTLWLSEAIINLLEKKLEKKDITYDIIKNIFTDTKNYIWGFDNARIIERGNIDIFFKVCFNKEKEIWQFCENNYEYKISDGKKKLKRKTKKLKRKTKKLKRKTK
jgi:ankyrin repeat protein